MKHLKGLADSGVTDVHLLPVFDIASVQREVGCTTPSHRRRTRCRNPASRRRHHGQQRLLQLGLRPLALQRRPKAAYASDGHRRRSPASCRVPPAWCMGTARRGPAGGHGRGLQPHHRVSGQNDTSRAGQASCPATTSTPDGRRQRWHQAARPAATTPPPENLMMGKLMIDSVASPGHATTSISSASASTSWVTSRALGDGGSCRPASTPPPAARCSSSVKAGTLAKWPTTPVSHKPEQGGAERHRHRQLWPDKMRDAVRGGGCCDSPAPRSSANQGFVNGLFYEQQPAGPPGRRVGELTCAGMATSSRPALAGSIKELSAC